MVSWIPGDHHGKINCPVSERKTSHVKFRAQKLYIYKHMTYKPKEEGYTEERKKLVIIEGGSKRR